MFYNSIWVVVTWTHTYSSSCMLKLRELYCVVVTSQLKLGKNEREPQPCHEVGGPVLGPLRALPKRLLGHKGMTIA